MFILWALENVGNAIRASCEVDITSSVGKQHYFYAAPAQGIKEDEASARIPAQNQRLIICASF
jgi:hypothetical protein